MGVETADGLPLMPSQPNARNTHCRPIYEVLVAHVSLAANEAIDIAHAQRTPKNEARFEAGALSLQAQETSPSAPFSIRRQLPRLRDAAIIRRAAHQAP